MYRIDKCEENPPLLPVPEGESGHVMACWVDVRSEEVIDEPVHA
jgi:hypothetical protein